MTARRWWGGGRIGEPEERLSVLDLYNSGTLDLHLAGLLWLIMEQRASILVASGPMMAGKTTLLNVMLDFLHPAIKEIRMQGLFEDFSFLKDSKPSDSYLVAEEFSGDRLEYMWGEQAQKAFNLMSEGFSIAGTIHAQTARETIYLLNEYLGLPAETIGRLGAILTIKATRGRDRYSEPIRRIDSVSLLFPHENSISIQMIVTRELGTDRLVFTAKKEMQDALRRKFAFDQTSVETEIDLRGRLLARLLTEGKTSRDQVRTAIVEFYASRAT
jgi:hypothetical protein